MDQQPIVTKVEQPTTEAVDITSKLGNIIARCPAIYDSRFGGLAIVSRDQTATPINPRLSFKIGNESCIPANTCTRICLEPGECLGILMASPGPLDNLSGTKAMDYKASTCAKKCPLRGTNACYANAERVNVISNPIDKTVDRRWGLILEI